MASDDNRYRVSTPSESAAAVDEVLARARYRVDVLSPELDPDLYDRLEVVDALRQVVVVGGRRAHIRILLRDGNAVMRRGHRLARLAQSLTTAIEVRRCADDDAYEETACLIVDRSDSINWADGAGHSGQVCLETPSVARKTESLFLERWERAQPEPELRKLRL